ILRKLTRAGFTVGSHDVLERGPRGLDPGHARAELLKRKGLIVTFPAPSRGLLVARRLIDWLVTHAKRAVPLVEWLASVGEKPHDDAASNVYRRGGAGRVRR